MCIYILLITLRALSFLSFSCLYCRCKCSNCSLELVAKVEECRCCMEVDRCRESIEEVAETEKCITFHPGFTNVCLNHWVLKTVTQPSTSKFNLLYGTCYIYIPFACLPLVSDT